MSKINDYEDALEDLPATGQGCHTGLLSVANYAVMAGIKEEDFMTEIREYIDESSRKVPDKEILGAYETAARDLHPASELPADHKPRRSKAKINVEPADLDLESLPESSEDEIMALSPEPIPERTFDQTNAFLKTTYSPSDLLFIGENYHDATLGTNLKPSYEWMKPSRFYPLIIANPLSGKKELTKDGKLSFRAQSCVVKFEKLVVEFDKTALEKQLSIVKFLVKHGPVVSVTFSGSKSYHVLLMIDARDLRHFESLVNKLRPYLLGLGADKACWHPDRLTRLPGAARPDKGKVVQKLIYLNGKPELKLKDLIKAFKDLAGENKPMLILPGGSQSIIATGKTLGKILAATGRYFMRGGILVEVAK